MRRLLVWILRALVVVMALALVYVAASVAYVHRHERDGVHVSAPAGGHFTVVDGDAVFSQSHGAATGTPILLVHGTAAWSGTWFTLVPALERAGYRVIAVDLPPFGYSGKAADADFSRHAQARRLLAVLDDYGVHRAIVVGHSFGGGPALELAMTAQSRVQRLVLIDAALGLQAPAPDPASFACRMLGNTTIRHALIASTATNPLWSRTLLRSFVARKEAVTPERLAQYRRPSSLSGATDALGAWGFHFACQADHGASRDPSLIRSLRVPLALLWGADDTVTPLSQARHLQSLLPEAPLHVIDSVGHIPHIEDPVRFESALLKVLRTPQGTDVAGVERNDRAPSHR